MLNGILEKSYEDKDYLALVKANIAGYLIVDKNGAVKQTGGRLRGDPEWASHAIESVPALKKYLSNGIGSGGFYKSPDLALLPDNQNYHQNIFIGPLPNSEDSICLVFDIKSSFGDIGDIKSEVVILSLISQAVRAFNRAENLETILKIVLIGVTAGRGLGFNRAFILLTCDQQNCLRGALANGPASPEEANTIWSRLSSGEITLERMFEDALERESPERVPFDDFLMNISIPLDNKDNIFAKAALEKKSMIIDEYTLAQEEYSNLHSMIGPGPLAVVPLTGQEYLQGVLIADNFITRKEITENDLHLLEIFARYASDSIKNFRLYENLEKKIDALKMANETIIHNRENMIKAERLSVLAEMAGEVAHEIRNPLTIIGGFAKSLLKKMDSKNSSYEYLNIIFEQVERISQSLEKFTSLINYESPNEKICDLADLVNSAIDVRTPGSNFSKFIVNQNKKVKVKTDPDLFRQALIIILKHINSINDESLPVNLSIDNYEDRALVYFDSDNYERRFAEKIYKSFYSGGSHEKLKHLSTTLEILKYYRGNIGIEAKENEGKRFYVELPVFKEEQ